MGLTPGMAEGSGRLGYYGEGRTCNFCGRSVWAGSFVEHLESHEEIPVTPIIVKPGGPDWTIAGYS